MNWKEISKQEGLSEDFMLEHVRDLDFREIIKKYQLSSDMLDSLFENKIVQNLAMIDEMCKTRHFEEWVIDKYADALDWSYLSTNPFLTERIIEKYQQRVDWDMISHYIPLSESFIEIYMYRVNFRNILANQKLSLSFLQKYKEEIDSWALWGSLSYNQFLTKEILLTFQEDLDWKRITRHVPLSTTLIEEFEDWIDWSNLARFQNLSEACIEKHQDRLDWGDIAEIQILSFDFVVKHIDKIDLECLSYNISNAFSEEEVNIINAAKNS